jgi:hypothetical protein
MQPIEPFNPTIHLAIELSTSTWLVAAQMPTSEKIRLHRIHAGDAAALLELIKKLQPQVAAKLGCVEVIVVSCFEAGATAFGCIAFLLPMGSPTT